MKILAIVAAILIAILAGINVDRYLIHSTSNEKVSLSTDITEFFKLCTGVEIIDKETGYLAISNCMGRVRGLVDGHQMTVVMQQRYATEDRKQPAPQLWCVDEKVNDKQVLDTVLNWVNNNPAEFEQIVSTLGTDKSATTAMAITVKALHQSFPCSNA